MKTIGLCLGMLLLLLTSATPLTLAASNENETEEGKGLSGLVVPRFASLRSGEVNMRTGPGTRYPIEWVFNHPGLPVEIISEYEIWRRVRDPEGAEGWVHKSSLSGKRMAIITGSTRDLYRDADEKSPTLAHLEIGVTGQVLSCAKDWCKLKFESVKGYLPKTAFWGAYPKEVFD